MFSTPLRFETIPLVRRGAKRYVIHDTQRNGAKRKDRYGTVRNGTVGVVHCEMMRERQCDRNAVVRSDMMRWLQCGKLRCCTVFAVWWHNAVQ